MTSPVGPKKPDHTTGRIHAGGGVSKAEKRRLREMSGDSSALMRNASSHNLAYLDEGAPIPQSVEPASSAKKVRTTAAKTEAKSRRVLSAMDEQQPFLKKHTPYSSPKGKLQHKFRGHQSGE